MQHGSYSDRPAEGETQFINVDRSRYFDAVQVSKPVMKWINSLLWLVAASAAAQSTEGLYNLVKRRLPNHVDDFRFDLKNYTASKNGYDQFEVRTASNGTVLVEGNTVSALSSGYVIRANT